MTWATIAQLREKYQYSRSTVDRMLPRLRAAGVAVDSGRLTRVHLERFECWLGEKNTVDAPKLPVQTSPRIQ
jgi:hypothetical protein